MTDDPDDVFGPKVQAPDSEPTAPRLKQTEMRPLADIQAQLRAETVARAQGKRLRRQV